ncbi:hypothetical protein GCM10023331_17090 [Algivirga pacifica]|uniref:Exonuclease domain-containing protein n=2 Tax=Algivirga pacifica TaxID=1162670 RepID=A0ABP9DB24_9BACT
MEFVALDFETANRYRSSACQVGLAHFKEWEIIHSSGDLIVPTPAHFEYMNIQVHGILPEHVVDKPNFEDYWPVLHGFLENRLIVAHNASFDISVLKSTLDHYGLPYPNLQYVCTMRLSKKLFPHLENHKLSTVSQAFGIALDHHEAESDSLAAGWILKEVVAQTQAETIEEVLEQCGFRMGKLSASGAHQSFGVKR